MTSAVEDLIKSLHHTLKLVPSSQRELFTTELASQLVKFHRVVDIDARLDENDANWWRQQHAIDTSKGGVSSHAVERMEALREERKKHVPIFIDDVCDWSSDDARKALLIIEDLIEDEDCSFDHHGYCQTHGWFTTERMCPQHRAKKFVKHING